MRRTAALLVTPVLLLAACGGSADDPVAGGMDGMSGSDGMSGMDGMGDMVMDEPDAPTAAEVAADHDAVTLLQADFDRFDDTPERFADAGGTVAVALAPEGFEQAPGTTVTLQLSGLPAGEEIISHLHALPCSERGGPHFQFDPEGSTMPPNEVHLAGTPDEDGTLTLNVTNERPADPAQAIVFHPRSDTDTYVACADLYTQG